MRCSNLIMIVSNLFSFWHLKKSQRFVVITYVQSVGCLTCKKMDLWILRPVFSCSVCYLQCLKFPLYCCSCKNLLWLILVQFTSELIYQRDYRYSPSKSYRTWFVVRLVDCQFICVFQFMLSVSRSFSCPMSLKFLLLETNIGLELVIVWVKVVWGNFCLTEKLSDVFVH